MDQQNTVKTTRMLPTGDEWDGLNEDWQEPDTTVVGTDGAQAAHAVLQRIEQAWGSRPEVRELAMRVKKMMPGGEKLSWLEALLLAQYGLMYDANVLRGEVYVYIDKRGRLVLVEGYKLLVRWAEEKGGFIAEYEDMHGLGEGDIGVICHLMRKDNMAILRDLAQASGDFERAWELCRTSAPGVLKAREMVNQQNQPIAPPKTWTWRHKASVRALKNALRMSFGAPSPSEVAKQTWQVGDVATTPEDWAEAMTMPGLHPPERERVAALSAQTRTHLAELEGMTPEELDAQLVESRTVLHGTPEDQEGI